MKIKNLIFTVLVGAAALFTSCMPEEPVINTLEGIELGSTYITIAKGQASATTTMKIVDSWTSSVPEWLTMEPASGSAGDYTLTFIAKADTLSQGDVNITFSGKTQKIIVIRDGEKPKPAGVLFEEPFIGHGQGDFEIKDIVGNPWSYDAKYGMKATAYISGANTDADSYLISPELDLTDETTAILTFEDAVNYMDGNPVESYLSVEVTADNGSNWEKVSVPTWPAGSGWDFVRSGDVDLSKFVGQKIKFAFHYTSNTKASPTWEVKNVKVSNVAGAVPPELAIEPESVVLAAEEGSSAFVKVTTDGEIAVTGPFADTDCKEAADDASWVTVVAAEGGYTITASANEGDARKVYYLFTSSNANGSVEAVLKVTQAAKPGSKGSDPSNPFSVAEIIAALKSGDVSGNVYVKGIISNTTKYNYGPSYNTASFWLSDDGVFNDDLDKDFEAYSAYWLGGSLEAPTAAADIKANFAIGDEVILYGEVTAYTSSSTGKTTYETASKKAKIYSINWALSDDNGVGNLDYPFNTAGAIQFILDTQKAVAAAKEVGETIVLPDVAVAGKASKIVYSFDATHKTGTFWLSDDGVFNDDLEKDFEAYGVYWLENKEWQDGYGQVEVGDEVIVRGQLTAYTSSSTGKTTYETSSKKAYLYSLNGETKADAASTDTWDYTPSDEYLSAANLWKAVDENHTVSWFYNPNWAGELSAPETSFKESTYTIQLNEADDSAEWTSQMWIKPASDFLLDPQKKYTFSCKVHSTTGTDVFIKMYEDGVNWPESFESPATPNRISIAAGETREVVVENFVPLSTPQILLIDFAHHGADNTIHVKDIVVKETGTVTPAGEWDYNPGAGYLADDNLWKANAAGNEMYYYYHCTGADWNGTDTFSSEVPFLTVKESTYGLEYADATTQQWQNQFFIYPAEGHEIALGEANTYKLQLTLGSNVIAPAFFKIEKYNPQGPKHEGELIWEYGAAKLDPSEPLVLEHEITGVSCDNIILVFDFGGNSADTKVYIKDITLVKTAGEEPAQGPSTIAGIIAAIPESATGNNTAVEFEANLTSPAVVSYVNGKNAYIQDETGAILLYLTDHGLTAGDAIKGKLSVKAYWYNGIPEMVAVGSEYEKTSGTAPSPKEITIADLLANYDANLLRLVKLSGVTVTDGIADGDRNGKIVQGGAEIAVYAQLNNVGLTLAEGANGDLVTIPGYYKTNKQVYFWDNAWFTEN